MLVFIKKGYNNSFLTKLKINYINDIIINEVRL